MILKKMSFLKGDTNHMHHEHLDISVIVFKPAVLKSTLDLKCSTRSSGHKIGASNYLSNTSRQWPYSHTMAILSITLLQEDPHKVVIDVARHSFCSTT